MDGFRLLSMNHVAGAGMGTWSLEPKAGLLLFQTGNSIQPIRCLNKSINFPPAFSRNLLLGVAQK